MAKKSLSESEISDLLFNHDETESLDDINVNYNKLTQLKFQCEKCGRCTVMEIWDGHP